MIDEKTATWAGDVSAEVQQKMGGELTAEDVEYLIALDFEIWCRNYAYFKGIDGKKSQGLPPNILQLRVIDHYRKCQKEGKPCLIMILKPRQRGASTIAEAVIYHHMRKHNDLNGVLMGDVQSTSDKVFEMFRRYAEEDTFPWRDGQPNIAKGLNLADEITLSTGSKWWKETAGSTNAGRSGTVQVLHMDEVAYFPSSDSKDPTTAVLGSFYRGPQSLGFATSTAAGPTGWFHDTWWGKNDWCKIFAAWFEFPECATPFKAPAEREEFERTMTKDEILEASLHNVSLEQLHWRRSKIDTDYQGDTGKFKQEYPSTPEGAFLSSSRMRFDEEGVNNQLAWSKSNNDHQCGNLILQTETGPASWLPDPRGSVKRWEEPIIGCRYLVSVDTCSGEDQQTTGTTADPDYHSVGVWRAPYIDRAGRERRASRVASHHSRLDTDILCEIIAGMARYYGNCIVIPEINGQGGLHTVKLLVNKYKLNVYRRAPHQTHRKAQTDEEKIAAYGWATDKLTRKWIIDGAVQPIRQETVEIKDHDVWEEFRTFIVTANGGCQAAPSRHDDRVIETCIALYNLGAATEYRFGMVRGIDISRLGRDANYLCADGFRRTNVQRR
jgi:hypothetical protein